jgi:hypothetical protein
MPDANPRHIVDERLDDPASYLTCPEATGYLGDLPTNFPHNDAKSSAQPTGPAHGIEQLPRVR